jgi:CBS domain-containing protein
MQVQELMSHPALTCYVTDSLAVPARLMWDHDCGAIPVVDEEGKLAGMITDRDICMAALSQGVPIVELAVAAVMAKQVIAVEPAQKLGEAEQLMARYRVRRLPVVDAHGRPVGVLSLNDLAIESVQPDTPMKHGPAKIAHTLAAISQHRAPRRRAA